MYKVFTTQSFLNSAPQFSQIEKIFLKKMIGYLKTHPFQVKPLGYRFLREKKIKNKRIYFLIYTNIKIILIVAASTKKDQSEVILAIKANFQKFKELAEKIAKRRE